MTTLIILLFLTYGFHRMTKAVPRAIKFGLENRETLRGGTMILKRLLGK